MRNLWNLQSRLLVAIQNNDVASAENLLQSGVDADMRFQLGSQKRPAICLCVERGHVEMSKLNLLAQLLMQWGCSINQYDSSGLTPLHIAASQSYIHVVALLLKNRANVKAITNYGHTPLHLATQQSSLEIVKMLVDAGSELERRDQDGRTPLSIACMHNRLEMARYLIGKGVDINAIDSIGSTPLLHSVCGPRSNVCLVSLLLDSGAKVNVSNKHGETPLLTLIRCAQPEREGSVEENLKTVQLLVDRGSNLDVLTPLGQSPLHLAIVQHQEQMAECLLRSGCDPNTLDALSLSPLFHLMKDGRRYLAWLLLSAGADLSRERWIRDESLLSEILDERMRRWILQMALEFPTLKHLCRVSIRQYLGRRADCVIASLVLPPPIMQYMTLQVI